MHLNRGGCEVASSSNTPLQECGEVVVLIEVIKRGHGIWYVGPTDIDLVSVAKCICLKGVYIHVRERLQLVDFVLL